MNFANLLIQDCTKILIVPVYSSSLLFCKTVYETNMQLTCTRAGLPGFFCSRIPNFQQLDAKIKCEIPNFLWFLLAIRNKLSISVNLLYP